MCGPHLLRSTVVEELVLEGLAAAAAVHEEILELGEASEVDLELRVAPLGGFTQRAAAKAMLRTADLLRTRTPARPFQR